MKAFASWIFVPNILKKYPEIEELRTRKFNLYLNTLSWKFRYLYLNFESRLWLTVRIIKEKNKNGWHNSRRHVRDPTSNLEEIRQRNKKQEIQKTLKFYPFKKWSLQLSYKWSYFQQTSFKDKKTVCLRNKKAHKLETLKCILEKTIILLQTSWLRNCGEFLIWHPKNCRSFYPKCSTDLLLTNRHN